MEIMGKKGLGNFLKILLQIVLVIGILILVSFPVVLRNIHMNINPNIVIFYPNAICLLLIIYQFIGLFDSLKNSNPFSENTVKRLKYYISSAFVIDSTHMMCQAGRIPKRIQILCDALLMHPIISLRQSRMVVSGMALGDFTHIAKHYVRKMLISSRNIDRRILFITYSGMDEEKLKYIQALVRQYCPFERIYLQKASSAVACNCGPGSFGLLFMRKNEAIISYSGASNPN